MDKLRLLSIFVNVVDSGSFADTAAKLGLSPSTVSKAVSRLESDLGIKLFHRTTRQLSLTVAGEAYTDTARHVLKQLEECEDRLKADISEPRGALRISLPVSYGRLYIMPLLQQFNERYPDIDLEISFSDEHVDMVEQRVDVCVRSGHMDDSRLVVRQVSPIDFLICGSLDYLERHGTPYSPEAFHQHRWIRFRFKQTGRLLPIMMPGETEELHFDPGRQIIVDDGEALAELCADGLGLTQLPHFIARKWVFAKRIKPIFSPYRSRRFGVYIIYIRRHYLPSNVRVFVDFLRSAIEQLGEKPFATWTSRLTPS